LIKQILITGSSGQIGSILVDEIQKRNYNFLGIDKVSKKIKEKNFIQIDITKKNNLKKIKPRLKNIDTVIHLASTIDGSKDIIKDGIKNIELNIVSTLELINSISNLKHFIYISSYMIYGLPEKIPVKETDITNPTNIYGASKLITEKYLDVLSKNKNFKLTILRLMGVYGTYTPNSWQAIPTFINAIKNNKNPTIYGNGKEKRNHIYIDDVVKGILCALKSKKSGIYNIGGVETPSNLEIINLINKKLGKTVKPKFVKVKKQHDFVSDISYAKKKLDFFPKQNFEENLSKTIELYLNK
jgi:UDP-glucose 4-epimerase